MDMQDIRLECLKLAIKWRESAFRRSEDDMLEVAGIYADFVLLGTVPERDAEEE